jgi:hypothetical protein
MEQPLASTSGGGGAKVVVHPLVLLSVVDHYARVAKDTKKRVVGILLGQKSQGRIDVTNSYAVPFEVKSPSFLTPDPSSRGAHRLHARLGTPDVINTSLLVRGRGQDVR